MVLRYGYNFVVEIKLKISRFSHFCMDICFLFICGLFNICTKSPASYLQLRDLYISIVECRNGNIMKINYSLYLHMLLQFITPCLVKMHEELRTVSV